MDTQSKIINAAIKSYMSRVGIASMSGFDCRPYVYFKTGEMALVMAHETPPHDMSVWTGTLVNFRDYDCLYGVLRAETARCPML